MRFQTQRVAYPYWVVALLLYGLQMVFGLLAMAKYLGPDPIQGAYRLHGSRLLGGSGGVPY